MTGGVVPVHIHSVAQGVGVFFGGGGGTGARRDYTDQLNPDFAPQQQTKSALSEIRDQHDQHGEASIRSLQSQLKDYKKISSDFDRHSENIGKPEFDKLQKKYFPGVEVGPRGADVNLEQEYNQLKKQFFTNLNNVFTASKFKGGGADLGELIKGNRQGSQLEAITGQLLGLDAEELKSDYVQSAFDIGTALHAKMQKKIKDEAEAAGRGGEVEIEKFVYLKPKEFVEGVRGPITGFIDVAYKNAQGQVEKISDIKTTGETFAKFESISRAIGPEGTIALADILDKEIPEHIRQKLEDYRSQLNVYLGALVQSGQAAPGVQASIDFIPSEDAGLTTPAKSVTFGFDPERLKSDLETLKTARELVNNYVLDLSTSIEDVPEEHQDLVSKLRKRVSGKSPAFSKARNLKSYLLEQELDKIYGVTEQSDEFIEEYVQLSRKAFEFMEGKEGVYKETRANFKAAENRAKDIGQAMKEDPEYGRATFGEKITGGTPEERTLGKDKVKKFPDPLKDQLAAISELHQGSIAIQSGLSDLNFNENIEKMHTDIKSALSGGAGEAPPTGPQFSKLLTELVEGDYITFQESMKAWQLWRISMGDFLIFQAKQAEEVFDVANAQGPATREFSDFRKRVEKSREFIVKSLGKTTDIYTKDRRFLLPDLAKQAGVFQTPEDLYKKTKQPFGEGDERTRGIYKNLIDKLEAGGLGAPAEEIRKLVDELADVDEAAKRVLMDVDLFERKGRDATEAWDFEKVAKRARVLREALSQYSRFNLSDEFQTDVEKKFQVRSLLQYLKQIEQVYGKIDLGRLQRGAFGEYETGAVKVPTFLPPNQQQALHRRNIEKFKQFAERPGPESDTPGTGPRVGESFSYFEKVTDSAGNVLRNFRHDFKKFGEPTVWTDQIKYQNHVYSRRLLL